MTKPRVSEEELEPLALARWVATEDEGLIVRIAQDLQDARTERDAAKEELKAVWEAFEGGCSLDRVIGIIKRLDALAQEYGWTEPGEEGR